MAKLSISLLLLFLFLFSISGMVEPAAPAARSSSRTRAYIEAACRATRYPRLCVQCLSGFANSNIQNPQQLAQVALSASLYRARHTKKYILEVAAELKAVKAKEYQIVKDCVAQINDIVEQLSQSIIELRRLGQESSGGDDIIFHLSNVEAWVSAALTDASTCADQFPGTKMSKLKATIKGKVWNVAQTTSNALALFHWYAAKYQAKMAKIP